jgi:hypothetical protein
MKALSRFIICGCLFTFFVDCSHNLALADIANDVQKRFPKTRSFQVTTDSTPGAFKMHWKDPESQKIVTFFMNSDHRAVFVIKDQGRDGDIREFCKDPDCYNPRLKEWANSYIDNFDSVQVTIEHKITESHYTFNGVEISFFLDPKLQTTGNDPIDKIIIEIVLDVIAENQVRNLTIETEPNAVFSLLWGIPYHQVYSHIRLPDAGAIQLELGRRGYTTETPDFIPEYRYRFATDKQETTVINLEDDQNTETTIDEAKLTENSLGKFPGYQLTFKRTDFPDFDSLGFQLINGIPMYEDYAHLARSRQNSDENNHLKYRRIVLPCLSIFSVAGKPILITIDPRINPRQTIANVKNAVNLQTLPFMY